MFTDVDIKKSATHTSASLSLKTPFFVHATMHNVLYICNRWAQEVISLNTQPPKYCTYHNRIECPFDHTLPRSPPVCGEKIALLRNFDYTLAHKSFNCLAGRY